jgi:multidrug resistance efflux pump
MMLQVQRDARITAAQLEDARARLELLRLGSRAEDIEEADARRDAASAALEEAKARLAQCGVASPIDGVFVARFASVGQLVSTAEPMVLLQIENDRKLDLRVDVEEAHLADLCLGQRASAATSTGAMLGASVERISPTIDASWIAPARPGEAAPGHVTATLKLDQQSAGLVPGEHMTVRFEPCRS